MTIKEMLQAWREKRWPHEKMQDPDRVQRYTLTDGPMYYLGQQICRAMQDAGYPAKIIECYRSEERQKELLQKRRTQAGPGKSPHQYFEAVDIVHPSKYWNVSRDYWDALSGCVWIVAQKYGVNLTHGHEWTFVDSAHIEITDWRNFRDNCEGRKPTPAQLWLRFQAVLPNVAKRAEKDGRAPRIADETEMQRISALLKS